MTTLVLDPETRWQSHPSGFRRHHRMVEVVGPATLWQLLASPGCCLRAFLSRAAECGVKPSLAASLVSRLRRMGLLEELLLDSQGKPQLARQVAPRYAPTAPVEGQSYCFSRCAFLRRSDWGWMLESSRGLARLRVLNEDLLGHLSEARSPLSDWQVWLVECDILVTEEQLDQESRSPWTFSDRLFHQRTRYGNHHDPIGKKVLAAPQPPPDPDPESKIFLGRPPRERPNPEWLTARRCLRQPQGGEWSLQRIGEFLHLSVAAGQERRPYPSAGGVYEIEFLLCWTQAIPGVKPGAFLYLAQAHALLPLQASQAYLAELLARHQYACQSHTPPTVSIVLAARFEKIFARYDSIAYALVLKNAGVLLHQFGLVATWMGWGGCPIGAGDSQTVAQLTGEDSEVFAAVAEFALW